MAVYVLDSHSYIYKNKLHIHTCNYLSIYKLYHNTNHKHKFILFTPPFAIMNKNKDCTKVYSVLMKGIGI